LTTLYEQLNRCTLGDETRASYQSKAKQSKAKQSKAQHSTAQHCTEHRWLTNQARDCALDFIDKPRILA
jgi:hypothetical protein